MHKTLYAAPATKLHNTYSSKAVAREPGNRGQANSYFSTCWGNLIEICFNNKKVINWTFFFHQRYQMKAQIQDSKQ